MKLRATCNCGCDNVCDVILDDVLNADNSKARSFAEMEMIATMKQKCWKGKITVQEVKDHSKIEETKLYLKLKENLENAIESLNKFNDMEINSGFGNSVILKNLRDSLKILKRNYTGKYFWDLDSVEVITEYNKDTFCQEEKIKPKDVLQYP